MGVRIQHNFCPIDCVWHSKLLITTEGATLYLVFPVIVIVISAMFTFYFCSKLQDKHLENTMTMTGKTRYNAPPWESIFFQLNGQFEHNFLRLRDEWVAFRPSWDRIEPFPESLERPIQKLRHRNSPPAQWG